ncbi:MAG: cytochrome c [Myxococcales bacterium]|nr:cytochrome c [Myxococcales bacterium]
MSNNTVRTLGAALVMMCSAPGCQKTTQLPPIEAAPLVSAEAKAAGATLYSELCVRCHGVSGWGDGPEALASRKVRVQDLGDPVWQSNVSNDRLRAVILRGGPGVRKSPVMPAFPQLAKNKDELDGLVAYVRSLSRSVQ